MVNLLRLAVYWLMIFAQTALITSGFPRPSRSPTAFRITVPADLKSPAETHLIEPTTSSKKLLRKPSLFSTKKPSKTWLLKNTSLKNKFELSNSKKKKNSGIGSSPAGTFSITVDLPSGDFNYIKPVNPGGQIVHRTKSDQYSYSTSGCVNLHHVQLRFLLQAYFHHQSQTCFALYFLAMRNLQENQLQKTSSVINDQLQCR